MIMMSGPHPLHAGDGYEYLTRQVASQDRDRDRSRDLTDYYTEHGTPPGQWWGKGADLLGISGAVREEQMQALFGEGLHPEANAIIAEALENGATVKEAVDRAKIGRMLSEFSPKKTEISEIYDRKLNEWIAKHRRRPNHDVRMMLRTDAAHEHLCAKLGRKPTRQEINATLGAQKKLHKRAVAGFDCVFTPPKSVSVIWGLADDKLRRAIYECHRDAVLATLEWAEEHFALTRRGTGGIRQIDAEGLTVAMFEHYDNRTGDPNPHTHCVISARVMGSDEKWSALDARALFAGGTSLSCMYNALNAANLKHRIGFAFEDVEHRGKEPVLEIKDVARELRDLFSRRPDIVRVTEQLIAQYRATHGRNPSKRVQIKLAEQATLATRDAKPVPKSLREMVEEWDQRFIEFDDQHRTGQEFVAEVLRWHTDPHAVRPYDAEHAAIRVGVELGGREGILSTNPSAVDSAIADALRRYQLSDAIEFHAAFAEVRSLLNPRAPTNALAAVDAACAAADARVYDPVRIAREVTEKVARRRATWTEAHIRSATWDRLARCDFPDVAALRAAVEDTVANVRDQHSIQLTIDPDEYPEEVCRRNGESQFDTVAVTTIRYSSEQVLAAENVLREAAQTPTADFLSRTAVDRAIAQVEADEASARGADFRLNSGQREIVTHLCTSGMRLDVAVGAAGAGKTTAMKAAVRAWLNDGRQVVALAPSAAAADVLSQDVGVDARTIDSLLMRVRMGNPSGLVRGAMILVDEAAMASTPNLYELQRIADTAGAVVRYVGDPYQLSAVESGGMMRLLAQETKAPELVTVVRFRTEGEAPASLQVRNGDARIAFDWYKDQGRITSGMSDELREKILAEYVRDRAAGTVSLMMAATVSDVTALNGAAQAMFAASGEVRTAGPRTALSDGHHGYIGDMVVTRKNNNRLRVTRGKRAGSSVDNGNLWRITKIHEDGSLTVVGSSHRGVVHLPVDYVRTHTELGYATTVHRSQGMTVDRAYLLMNKALGRALAYVGLTRGKSWNGVYIATDTAPDPGIEIQPDDPDEPITERDIWLRVLAREDDNLTATEVMRAEQARISDPTRLRQIYHEITATLADTRGRDLLERALPVAIYHEISNSEGFPALLATIAVADQHGLNTVAMINHISTAGWRDEGQSLLSARDTTAVLRARADTWIAEQLHSDGTPASTRVDTLGLNEFTDTAAIIGAVAETNRATHLGTTQRRGRFYAVRDAEYDGIPPVPSRHPGMNGALADLAEEIRARLVGSHADTRAPAAAPRTSSERAAALDEYTHTTDPVDRRARLRRDYETYVRDLERARATYLLDHYLTDDLLRIVESGRRYTSLLDTIGLADEHRLDAAALVADICTRGGRDRGESLLTVRDASAILQYRADEWIADHIVTVDNPVTVLPVESLGAADTDTEALTQAVVALNRGADVLAWQPRTERFRALEQLGSPPGLRPIPPEYPGMDTAVADYADELRRLLLDLPDDTPDWRARAAQRRPGDHDAIDIDEWISLAAANTELAYPDLDSIERVVRLRAELAAAQAQTDLLTATLFAGTNIYDSAIEDIVRRVRARADELAPLLRELRDAQDILVDAERELVLAEDAYHQLLHATPDAADEEFLHGLADRMEATEDPAVLARLNDLLARYLDATDGTDARTDALAAQEIATARRTMERAREFAEQVRADIGAAERALDAAAAQHRVVDGLDVQYVRDLATQLAGTDLVAARAAVLRLNAQLRTARAHAVDALVDESGIDADAAVAELDRCTVPTQTEQHEAMTRVLGRESRETDSLPAPDAAETVDAAVNLARRRMREIETAYDREQTPAPIDDRNAIVRLVRARADALLPWAIEAHRAELAWKAADAAALAADADHERARTKESDPWTAAAADPFVRDMQERIDALDPDSEAHAPLRAQMTEMLEQYKAAAADTADTELTVERTRAEQAAVAARARADQLRAAADTALRALAERQHEPITTAGSESAGAVGSVRRPVATQIERGEQLEHLTVTADTPMDQAAAAYLQTLTEAAVLPGEPDRRAPSWLPAPPPAENTSAMADRAREQYTAIIERTVWLGGQVADERPAWSAHLGPLPAGAVSRADWITTAGHIAAWREQHDITDPTTLLGDRPAHDPDRADRYDELTRDAHRLRTTAVDDATRHAQHDAEQERQRELDRQRQRELDQQRQHYRPTTPDHPTGLEP
ncbi:Dtr system oriT relaxase [Nocardia otitidiscaviarum]|uniref:Dtr system oriT relaxase n=2 Tax=Nocardia otitidiscaviarum TaxID=1823 RepID=A0A379JLN8_9NOCA|nr:Dtr system oriT relaxase [Nocardia otitidiscaviarum]